MKSQSLNPSDFIQLPRPLLYPSKTLLLQFPYSSLSLSQTPRKRAFKTKTCNAVSLLKPRRLSIRVRSSSGSSSSSSSSSSSNAATAPSNVDEDAESAQLFEVVFENSLPL